MGMDISQDSKVTICCDKPANVLRILRVRVNCETLSSPPKSFLINYRVVLYHCLVTILSISLSTQPATSNLFTVNKSMYSTRMCELIETLRSAFSSTTPANEVINASANQ